MANLCINSCRVDKQNLLNLLIRSSFDGSKWTVKATISLWSKNMRKVFPPCQHFLETFYFYYFALIIEMVIRVFALRTNIQHKNKMMHHVRFFKCRQMSSLYPTLLRFHALLEYHIEKFTNL
jgi:hypothetical protein